MSKIVNEDIGIGRGPASATDERLKKSADEGRTSRSMNDRKFTGDRELTDHVRASSKRDEFTQNILPDPPQIPGFKTIWLSTTHQSDTIPVRMQRGYMPVKLEDIPGYEAWALKSGEWAGFVGSREMLLFKLPVELWAQDMHYMHHEAPLAEEQGIKDSVMGLKRDLEQQGTKIEVGNGIDSLAAKVRAPKWV